MDTDNTHGGAEPSPASAGSQPAAWVLIWRNPRPDYLQNRFAGVFATREESDEYAKGLPHPAVIHAVFATPQPALTDEERAVIEVCATHWQAAPASKILRGLLERLG